MIKSEKLYIVKLNDLFLLQKLILRTLKNSEIIENKYFEERDKLISQIIILKPRIITKEALKLKQNIIEIESKINKEAVLLFEVSKLKIEQHNKSVNKMVNYFKSQINLQSEIDLNI